jgi:hypothetical protein
VFKNAFDHAHGDEAIMTAPARQRPDQLDITAAPRAVLRESVRLLYRVLGEDRLRTARGNAWEAVCADRENARGRAELDRLRNM